MKLFVRGKGKIGYNMKNIQIGKVVDLETKQGEECKQQ